jgi:osmotically-inducible protein OsmY
MPTDDELLREATHILKIDPGFDATNVSVVVDNGDVTLTGSVHSAVAKWMAKEAIKHVKGIKNINEKLKIISTERQ